MGEAACEYSRPRAEWICGKSGSLASAGSARGNEPCNAEWTIRCSSAVWCLFDRVGAPGVRPPRGLATSCRPCVGPALPRSSVPRPACSLRCRKARRLRPCDSSRCSMSTQPTSTRSFCSSEAWRAEWSCAGGSPRPNRTARGASRTRIRPAWTEIKMRWRHFSGWVCGSAASKTGARTGDQRFTFCGICR